MQARSIRPTPRSHNTHALHILQKKWQQQKIVTIEKLICFTSNLAWRTLVLLKLLALHGFGSRHFTKDRTLRK